MVGFCVHDNETSILCKMKISLPAYGSLASQLGPCSTELVHEHIQRRKLMFSTSLSVMTKPVFPVSSHKHSLLRVSLGAFYIIETGDFLFLSFVPRYLFTFRDT